MYITQLQVKNFRAFSDDDKEYNFPIGKYITCIAGHNGIGKSTLLAILGNCGELKVSKGRHLNGSQFRGEYSKIIKGNKEFDSTGEKCIITFSDLPKKQDTENPFVEKLEFRATFQNAKRKKATYTLEKSSGLYRKEEELTQYTRYRLLPKITDERPYEKKLEWPAYYLGLSRLYPLGESDDIKAKTIDNDILTKLTVDHKNILSSSDDYNSASTVSVSDTSKKSGFGITTDKYTAEANSSGQDNLGQILLTIYSFENLKNQLQDEYCGGIFLIDELDASLHPSAQNKLFDYLYSKSKELNLQIIFTTHSLSLLRHITTTNKLTEKNNSISLLYATNARGTIEVNHNPTYRLIQNDLLSTYSGTHNENLISVMTEDDVARWFLEKILSTYNLNYKISLLKNNLGWNQILNLILGDYNYYKNQISILDPDVKLDANKNEIQTLLKGTQYKFDSKSSDYTSEILSLPGMKPIEEIFWTYLSDLEVNNPFFYDPNVADSGLTKRSLLNSGPDTYPEDKQLKKIKRWFEDNKWVVDNAFPYWAQDNKEIILEFLHSFNYEYNKIAKRIGLNTVELKVDSYT